MSTGFSNERRMPGHYPSDGSEPGSPRAAPPRAVPPMTPGHYLGDEGEPGSPRAVPPMTPDHPLSLPAVYSPGSSPGSESAWSLPQSMLSSSFSTPSNTSVPLSKSAVGSTSPMPTLLTNQLMVVGDEAVANYDTVRQSHFKAIPELPTTNPFSSELFTPEALERFYVAAIDVKNALQLRKSAVKADIGDALELLLPKLSLYQRDSAILDTVINELRLIKEVCSDKGIKLSFFGLEFRRYKLSQYPRSVLEDQNVLFSALRYSLGQKDNAQQAAEKFIGDPYALWENRLPHSATSQR